MLMYFVWMGLYLASVWVATELNSQLEKAIVEGKTGEWF